MKIVIDIGAARYGGDYSIERLIDEFSPDILYAFDPNTALTAHPPGKCESYIWKETAVFAERLAAWTYKGEIGYLEEGLNSCLTDRADAPKVACFDLADFIHRRPEGSEIILKLDAEGSEFELLERIIETGADTRLKLAWVEWHSLPDGSHEVRRKNIEQEIACELQEWNW